MSIITDINKLNIKLENLENKVDRELFREIKKSLANVLSRIEKIEKTLNNAPVDLPKASLETKNICLLLGKIDEAVDLLTPQSK